MMMSEFIDRTGFEPTAKEYTKIEEAYYDFDGDKDAFCKAFVKDGGARKLCKARAVEIDRLNSLLLESERQYKKDMADREKRIDELMFYTECWRELRSFLSEVVRDNTGEYPFTQDVLNLMRSIERKYERF